MPSKTETPPREDGRRIRQCRQAAQCACLLLLMAHGACRNVPELRERSSARSFLYDPECLQFSKVAWRRGEPWAVAAVAALRAEADLALKNGPYSVTRSFPLIKAPGATPNDYITINGYYWPNPDTPDGLPYIKRPGHLNPDARGSGIQLTPLACALRDLGCAYYFTDDEAYARKAAALAREFFLNPATRMNPHTEFGKIIPGVDERGGFAVAALGNKFRIIYDSLGLLEASPHWTGNDKRAMQQWSADLLGWMESSPKGRKELRARGNHGSNYDLVAALLSMYVDDREGAAGHVRRYLGRLTEQFAPDGTQPLEMKAANNLNYSLFNLQVAADIADLGQRLGVDVWNALTPSGGGIRRSIDFLVPYFTGTAAWTFWPGEAFPLKSEIFRYLLQRAALGLSDPRLLREADRIGNGPDVTALVNLTHPRLRVASHQAGD